MKSYTRLFLVPLSLLCSYTLTMDPAAISSMRTSQNSNSNGNYLVAPGPLPASNRQLPNPTGRASKRTRAKLMQEIAQQYNSNNREHDRANIQALITFLENKRSSCSPENQQWINGQIAELKNELAHTIAQATIQQLPSALSIVANLADTITPDTTQHMPAVENQAHTESIVSASVGIEPEHTPRLEQIPEELEEFETLIVTHETAINAQDAGTLPTSTENAPTTNRSCCIQ